MFTHALAPSSIFEEDANASATVLTMGCYVKEVPSLSGILEQGHASTNTKYTLGRLLIATCYKA